MRPLRRDQLAVPAEDRVWRHDGRHLSEESPVQDVPLYCEPAALIIVEPQASTAELLLQHAVLLDEIGDDVGLLAVDPAGERGEEEPEPEEVHHRER